MDSLLTLRAAAYLLMLAFVSGLAMAVIRFASDRRSPPWLAKVHGFAAVAALTLLTSAWLQSTLSRAVSSALLLLCIAAAGGVLLNLGFRSKGKPVPEGLLFAHMSIAFLGFLIVGFVSIASPI